MRFQCPWVFLMLPAIPLVFWAAQRGMRRGTLRFSSLDNARRAGRSWRMRFHFLPLILRILTLILLIFGLARPQQGTRIVRDVKEGIAIEMAVDRSSSMGQELLYQGKRITRLEAVKRIFHGFVLGNARGLSGRPCDLVGMVAFARYAETVCPLTLSHKALSQLMESITLPAQQNEDGTALGDGLALAAARLRTAEESHKSVTEKVQGAWSSAGVSATPHDNAYKIKSKIIILLTDGQNNTGKRSPLEAARLAAKWRIKVYAIGIGGRETIVTVQTPLGDYKVPAGPGVDEGTLRAIAGKTGGKYYLAESADKLLEIYKEIDRLERTKMEAVHYADHAEKYYPLALAALIVMCLEQLMRNTLYRRIP